MKSFEYTWDDDHYLLHVELTVGHQSGATAVIKRRFGDSQDHSEEQVTVPTGVLSHRVMIARSHPREQAFVIELPYDISLKVFKLEDRAYYPAQPYYVA